jgi:hypothetical protein
MRTVTTLSALAFRDAPLLRPPKPATAQTQTLAATALDKTTLKDMRLLFILSILLTPPLHGQSLLIGGWTSQNFKIDTNNDTLQFINNLEKIKFTFNTDSTYIKSYYSREKSDSTPYLFRYKIIDNELIRKSFDQDGYELKKILVTEIIEKGQFTINSTQDSIIFKTENRTYVNPFSFKDTQLIIVEYIDSHAAFIVCARDKEKRKSFSRRGSR